MKSRRSKSSALWLKEHFSDPYVKKAQREGYRSRAVYKLQEILTKDALVKPGMNIVDLGAAPGGWSQYVQPLVGRQGKIWALDILPMAPLPHVTFIEGDFTSDETYASLLEATKESQIDLILSDMAPNSSGMKAVDQPRAMYLAELAFEFVQKMLSPGGSFIVKVFQGAGFDSYLQLLKKHFAVVAIRKPQASRKRSTEVYLVAKGWMEK